MLRRIAASLFAVFFIWFEWRLLLLVFAGLLVAIFLHGIATWIERKTFLNSVSSYVATVVAVVGVAVGLVVLLAPRVINQLSVAATTIPADIATAQAYLQKARWGGDVLSVLQRAWHGSGPHLTNAAEALVHAIVDVAVIVVIGFFGALNARVYRVRLSALVSARRRASVIRMEEKVVATLRSWLFGQMIPMTAIGLASMTALWLLHVPLAFTAGLVTGLLIFIPYLGSILSGLFAILLALHHSFHAAIYVFVLYCIFHLIEGYALTPLVQKKMVHLPPIVTILAQLLFWSFGGVLGVALAAPLAAVALAMADSLYPKPLRPRNSAAAKNL